LQEFEEVRRAFSDNGSPKKSDKKFFGTPTKRKSGAGQTSGAKTAEGTPFDDVLGDAGASDDSDVFATSDVFARDDSDGDDDDGELGHAAIVEDDDVDMKRSSMLSRTVWHRFRWFTTLLGQVIYRHFV
jgi:hypothetical protein